MRQQHAYYLEKYGRGGGNSRSARCSSTSNRRSINTTTSSSCPEDQYTPSSDEAREFHDPLNEDTQQNDPEEDPVLNTFQQFLSQSWYQNIFHTTWVYNLPGRAIHAHFARDSKYGHLISDNAADTGSLTPKYCHITFTSTQKVLVMAATPQWLNPTSWLVVLPQLIFPL